MAVKLQVALDFLNLSRALKVAEAAWDAGADILEVGTPLIKSEGLDALRKLRELFPTATIVADMKTMDTGRIEMEAAAKAGANLASVMGVAAESTIKECIEAGRNYGIGVVVDFLGVPDPVSLGRKVADWGAAQIDVHTPIDEQMLGRESFPTLKQLRKTVGVTLAVAGGINSETAVAAVKAGADIVIVGGAISKSRDPRRATEEIKHAIETGVAVETKLYKRVSAEEIREVLLTVSTPNISDGNHRLPSLGGIYPISQGLKMAGPAVTVRTYPGDWAKPVEAIDVAPPGSVIAIDAGSVGPAVWGELATYSCKQRGIVGVVIDGAIRDVPEIRKLKFPAFAKLIMPQAGEPKGFGEIGVAISMGGIRIAPQDWVVGDDDGVVVIPKARLAEMTNRAMEWLEKENRIRQEIEEGKTTLAQVMELLRWEKKAT